MLTLLLDVTIRFGERDYQLLARRLWQTVAEGAELFPRIWVEFAILHRRRG